MEISVVLALLSMAMSLPIIIAHHAPRSQPYNDGPIRRPLSPQPRERCRCGQCESCDPLYHSYGR